jgi:hypothetical protein
MYLFCVVMTTASNRKTLVHTKDCHSHEYCRSVYYHWHQLLNSFNSSGVIDYIIIIDYILLIPYNPQKYIMQEVMSGSCSSLHFYKYKCLHLS